MTQRAIVFNIILACLLGLLGYQGYLTEPYTGKAAPIVITISVLYAVFIFTLIRSNWLWAQWLAKNFTRFGLIGTVIGLLIAFKTADFSKDAQTVITSVLQGTYFAFWSTACGLITSVAGAVSIMLCGEESHE